MEVKKYRKKPVIVEAIQYNFNAQEISRFVGKQLGEYQRDESNLSFYLVIPTLEGNMECSLFDYVIKGVNGEFYPCKPDIFEKNYEVID